MAARKAPRPRLPEDAVPVLIVAAVLAFALFVAYALMFIQELAA